MAFFTLALIFAGTNNNVFGQLLPGITDPTRATPPALQPIPPISCVATASALNPIPGISFTYAMDNGVVAGAATSANWTWWATQDKNFILTEGTNNIATMLLSPTTTTAGTDLVASSPSPTYGTDNKGGVLGTNQVSITWSSSILAKTKYQATAADNTAGLFSTFVVGYSEGAAGCTDNIQVFEINPSPNFTIDIAAIDATGATLNWGVDSEERCVDKVQSAVYTIGTPTGIVMDYGTNTIYYEVAAANFVTNFVPQFRVISGLNTDQTAIISIYSTYADATNPASTPLWSSIPITAAAVTANTNFRANLGLTATAVADIATGVSFFVKVLIDNNTEESLLDNPFVLAVDAEDNVVAGTGVANTSSIWDMEDADCTAMDDTADQEDQSTITITPRPTLQMTPATTTLEPNTNAPDDLINKLP